ncbi:hypothetical protein FDP41_013712 [Naegleria fowleri]|uniref:C2 domain-containing protein n=1 Tax=Naegleria fowleri TaxID=5763 RepID=A0A6A5C3R4_NAEFO|nr:uncharacterized protein FDP41_013712 [Naegleria fowleri]KAF0980498.1 hypothetical protein FDP41_013712 [Naegleria fowleri]CAG4712717.1 unnamed protein product [Naegleria fowleri]
MPSLKVILKQANNLPAKDSTGTSDPLVVCTLNGKTLFKTEPIMMTLNPVWDGNAKIKHEFTVELKDIYHDQLILEVMDYNIFTKNKPIGSTVIPLVALERRPQIVTYCLSDSKNGPAGTITVLLEPLDFGSTYSSHSSSSSSSSGNPHSGMIQSSSPLQKSSSMNQSFHHGSSPQGFVPQSHQTYNTMRSQSVVLNTSPNQVQQNHVIPTFGNNILMNPTTSYPSSSPNAFSQPQPQQQQQIQQQIQQQQQQQLPPLPQQNQTYHRTQSFIQPNVASAYSGGSPSTNSFNSVSVQSTTTTKRDPKPLPTLPPKTSNSTTDQNATQMDSKRVSPRPFNGVVDDVYIDYVISQCPIPSSPFYSKSH